jgi:lipoprotein-anchoring transpeptidase ErfK/SrfK
MMGKDEAANAYGNGGEGGSGDPGSGWRMRAVKIAGRPVRVIVIGAAVAALVLIGGSVGVYAYDSAHKDQIADGVEVGGVDVGGLDREQAARRIHRRLVAPLNRPVKVKLGSERYTLPADHLKIRADVAGMVDEAIAASQSWGPPGRVFREVTGGSVDEAIPPEVSYSRVAVRRFVKHVAGEVNREPQDASIAATGSSLNVVPAENGRTLKEGKLQESLETALDNGGRNRLLNAHVVVAKPQVSTAEVASEYPVYLTVDRATYTVRLWKNLKLVKSYTVAVGQPAYPTPSGLFSVESKQVDPVWSVPNSPWAGELAGTTVAGGTAENPLRARWMGVTEGVGFHGTDETYSVGTAASHGCLRMLVPDVIELYDQVPVGTPVYIG